MNDKLIEKLRKLLSLGTSSNEHESALALEKARDLALKYDIELSSIRLTEPEKELNEIVRDDINLGQRKCVAQKFVSLILMKHFNVKLIYTGGRASGNFLVIIGNKTDVEIANYVNGFLNDEFMRLWHLYRQKNNSAITKDRMSYFNGLWNGLNQKLIESKKKSESNIFQELEFGTEARQSYALMKINQEEKIEKFAEKAFPNLRKGAGLKINHNSNEAFIAGRQDGEKINLNKGINNTNNKNTAFIN